MSMRPPAAVQISRVLLLLVGATHIAVPLVMMHARSSLAMQIATMHPEFNAATTESAVDIALRAALIFHGVLFALSIGLAMALEKPRGWVRRLATVSQLIAVLFSVVSWRSSAMFHGVIPLVDAAQIGIVLLLWFPGATHAFLEG